MENKRNETPESVPYIVFEGEMARMENHIKRLWITVISLVVAIVIVVGSFLWYLNQYDFESYQQDGEGVNIIGDGNGVDYNGPKSTSQTEKEPIDSEG